jgi:hypothetical protein
MSHSTYLGGGECFENLGLPPECFFFAGFSGPDPLPRVYTTIRTVRLTSIYNPQTEDKSHVTAAGLTNLFILARTSLLSELVLATIKKSRGTIGSWSNIWLQLEGRINDFT